MAQTVQELAEELFVDPDDIMALLELYPGDEDDLWEDAGMLSAEAADDVSRMVNAYGDSAVPELYLHRPSGRFPLPSRVAWTAGDASVHRGSARTGVTSCGQTIVGRSDGVTVRDEPLCPRCFRPDY